MVQKSGENQLRLAEYPHSLQGFISIYIPSGCWPWDFTKTINYVGNGAVSLGVSTPTHLRGNESEKPGCYVPKLSTNDPPQTRCIASSTPETPCEENGWISGVNSRASKSVTGVTRTLKLTALKAPEKGPFTPKRKWHSSHLPTPWFSGGELSVS